MEADTPSDFEPYVHFAFDGGNINVILLPYGIINLLVVSAGPLDSPSVSLFLFGWPW